MKFKVILIITLILFIEAYSAEINSLPKINVVYPPEGKEITSTDSTFIFGSVTPGSDLVINDQYIEVHKNGAFLAYLPLKPGDFVFQLEAMNQGGISSKEVIVKKIQNPDSFYFPAQACFDQEKMLVCLADSASGKVTIKEEIVPQIVELKDTSTIIRTGPGLGYLLLYQPQGVRFLANGRSGDWIRLRLAQNIEGWVKAEALNFLPPGTPLPESEIKFIRTETEDDRTLIRI